MENAFKFQVFQPGIAFMTVENQNQTIVGISHSSLSLRVYYHKKIKPVDETALTYFTFPVDAAGIWYNQILYKSQGSMLGTISENNISNLNLSSNELPSINTNNQTVVQGGSGVYTKIRIPGSQLLKGYGKNMVLINAKMQLTPQKDSYTINNPLPDSLAVYVVDRRNVISSQYTSSLGSNIFAIKVIPSEFDQLPYYLLDLTQFFTSELSSATTTGNSLMLGTLGRIAGQSINYFSFSGNPLDKNLFKMNVFCYFDKSN